jgi:hypothetical protein
LMGVGGFSVSNPNQLACRMGVVCVWAVVWRCRTWHRVVRCTLRMKVRGCRVRRYRLCRTRLGGRPVLLCVSCTSGRWVRRVVVLRGCVCIARFVCDGLEFCSAWGTTADALRLSWRPRCARLPWARRCEFVVVSGRAALFCFVCSCSLCCIDFTAGRPLGPAPSDLRSGHTAASPFMRAVLPCLSEGRTGEC